MNPLSGVSSCARTGKPRAIRSLKEARYRWYRAFFLPLVLVTACSPAEEPFSSVVGRLQNAKIDEASGIARSQRYPDVFWLANDDGPSVLYAIDGTGKDLGRIEIKDASNRDWEDLASFTLDGVPYLVAADIGDNQGSRKDVRLYVIEEPEAGDDKVKPEWRIEFTYPEGPRDAESIAVDVDNERVLILTKRDVPALLYAVPLQPGTKKRMYPRSPGQGWFEALQQPPLVVSRSSNRQAETVAFDAAGDFVYITLEQRNAPLFRLPVSRTATEK